MLRNALRFPLAILLVSLATPGCATLANEMQTAQRSYEEARYDEALVWLEDLEDDTPHMDVDMRARFYFLRGMTAYRRGDRDDALHYLAVAREVRDQSDAELPSEWNPILERTLEELVPTEATFHARAAETSGGGARSESSGGETESPAESGSAEEGPDDAESSDGDESSADGSEASGAST